MSMNLNFGTSKPRVKEGGPAPRGFPLDPHLSREEQNKFSKKGYLHWGSNVGP